jgi:hypothetical protein
MTLPKSKPRSAPSEKIEGFPIRVRNRITRKRTGHESLRDAARRLLQEKDALAPNIDRWLKNKR